jgi:hypothetical protein
MKKEKCTHIKIPLYDREHQDHADFLIKMISAGEISYYPTLTRLAVSFANAGKFYRETCEKCHGLCTAQEDSGKS